MNFRLVLSMKTQGCGHVRSVLPAVPAKGQQSGYKVLTEKWIRARTIERVDAESGRVTGVTSATGDWRQATLQRGGRDCTTRTTTISIGHKDCAFALRSMAALGHRWHGTVWAERGVWESEVAPSMLLSKACVESNAKTISAAERAELHQRRRQCCFPVLSTPSMPCSHSDQ